MTVSLLTHWIVTHLWWSMTAVALLAMGLMYIGLRAIQRRQSQTRLQAYNARITGYEERIDELQDQLTEYKVANGALSASLQALQQSSKEKLAMLQQAEQQLADKFERLANKIFDDKSTKFNTVNQQSMDTVVQPLHQKLTEFKQQIAQQSRHEGLERAALKQEIYSLKSLNEQINAQALALTQALKGDNKQQGNWGEVVLESILANCGLQEGQEYVRQTTIQDELGRRFQPDIVVNLPNNKAVIIDAKVSLSAYERYFKSDDELEQATQMKLHIQSIKQHVSGLASKDYAGLYGVQSLDYVLLFLASEAAFQAAIQQDPSLMNEALNQNIMLVSPSNLMVALKTINTIWQTEKRINMSQDIALQATKLHDKLVGFVAEMDKVGKQFNTAQSTYEDAMKKLATGRGSIVSMGHKLQSMGLKTQKSLPKE